MKQIYIEAGKGKHIPVHHVHALQGCPELWRARVKEARPGWRKGECITVHRRNFVQKTGKVNSAGFILVRQAVLPEEPRQIPQHVEVVA